MQPDYVSAYYISSTMVPRLKIEYCQHISNHTIGQSILSCIREAAPDQLREHQTLPRPWFNAVPCMFSITQIISAYDGAL